VSSWRARPGTPFSHELLELVHIDGKSAFASHEFREVHRKTVSIREDESGFSAYAPLPRRLPPFLPSSISKFFCR